MKDKIRIFTPELRDTKGLTILELAVAMIIMGVIIAGLLSIINPMIESGKIKETERKMERIVDVMAIYAQRNNRIPCPADPDRTLATEPIGAEVGSGSDGDNLGSCDSAGDLIEGWFPIERWGLPSRTLLTGGATILPIASTRPMPATLPVPPIMTFTPAAASISSGLIRIQGRT